MKQYAMTNSPLLLRIVDELVPKAHKPKKEEDLRQTRIVYVFMLVVFLSAGLIGASRFLRGDTGLGISIVVAALFVAISPFIHRIFGSLKLVSLWLIFIATFLTVCLGALSGGLQASAGIWYGPVIVFILVTQGLRLAFVWISIVTLETFLLYWLPRHGITIPDFQNPETKPITWLIAIPASLFATVSMLHGFFQAYHRAIEGLDLKTADLLKQTQELHKANEVAEAATRSRGEFIAIVSHEIRTPMNGILGVAQLITETNLNPLQKKYLQLLQISTEGLLSILNDILDFSKIESGKLEIRSDDFDLHSLCEECVALFSEMAKTKEINLHYYFQSSLPMRVFGDPQRLRQILINLLGNATKFTETGEISLNVTPVLEYPGYVKFAVKDSGIGMTALTIAKLFQPYTQADSSSSRKYGGTGLGLAICYRLTELLGGTISVESELGIGSCFWIQIPLHEMNLSEKVPIVSPINIVDKPIQVKSVLLVEDNLVNRTVALAMLEKLQVRAEVAKNGYEAVEQWKTGKFDFILMDCQMPEMDGYAATRMIRSLEIKIHPKIRIPIIALTAHAMEEDRQQCIDAGMDEYLTKPVKIEAIRKALTTHWSVEPS
jgi:signal transduction histidine kinase/CheY-like chemotaxis protein